MRAYVRESILTPQAKLVAGYQPLMPTFQGLVNEENVMALIEYVKSLQVARRRVDAAAADPAGTAPTAGRRRTGKTMATIAAPRVTYLNHQHTVASWLLTKDHKRIGLMYLVVVTMCVLPGRPVRDADPPRAGDARRRSASRPTLTTRCSRCTAWRWCSSC